MRIRRVEYQYVMIIFDKKKIFFCLDIIKREHCR